MNPAYPKWRTAPVRWVAKLFGVPVSVGSGIAGTLTIGLGVAVDTSSLDLAIERVKQLAELAEKAEAVLSATGFVVSGEVVAAELISTEGPTQHELICEMRALRHELSERAKKNELPPFKFGF